MLQHAVQAFLIAAILAPFSYYAGQGTRKLGLPQITGYLVSGIICGPYCLSILSATSVADLNIIEGACLGIIGLAAGAELHLPELAKHKKQVGADGGGLCQCCMLEWRLLCSRTGLQRLDVVGKPGISSTDMFTLSQPYADTALLQQPIPPAVPALSANRSCSSCGFLHGPHLLLCCVCLCSTSSHLLRPDTAVPMCTCTTCTPLLLDLLLRHAITLLLPSAFPCMQVVSLTAGICVASWVLCYGVLSYLAGSSLLPHLTGKVAAAAATLGATIMMARSPASAVSGCVWSVECGDKGAGGRGGKRQ